MMNFNADHDAEGRIVQGRKQARPKKHSSSRNFWSQPCQYTSEDDGANVDNGDDDVEVAKQGSKGVDVSFLTHLPLFNEAKRTKKA